MGIPGNLVVTPATAAMVVVSVITVLVLVWALVGLGRPRPGGRPLDDPRPPPARR